MHPYVKYVKYHSRVKVTVLSFVAVVGYDDDYAKLCKVSTPCHNVTVSSISFPGSWKSKDNFLVWTKITFNFTSIDILVLDHTSPLTTLSALDRTISPWPHSQPLTALSAHDELSVFDRPPAVDRTISPWPHYQSLTTLSARGRTISRTIIAFPPKILCKVSYSM